MDIATETLSLSLMSCTSRYSVAASAAMLGIAKEAQVMCEWMRKEDMLIDFLYGDFISEVILDSRNIRRRTLNVMIKMIDESSVAAGHDIGNKEPANTNGLGSNRNNIGTDELANATGYDEPLSNVFNSQDQKIKEPEKCKKGNMKGEDFLDNLWGWERLPPLQISFGWPDHSNYLEKYYNCNALNFIAEAAANQTPEGLLDPSFGSVQIVSKAGYHLADSVPIFCLKMEEKLLAEWKARVELPSLEGILPVNSIIHSSLVKEHVLSICGTGGEFYIPAAVAFVLCVLPIALPSIAEEADLMIELLKHGAEPDNDILEQSGVIRMCALGLVKLKGRQSIATAAAMMGMLREARMMRDWIKREKKLPSSILGEPLDLGEARLMRTRTLDDMISILQRIRTLDVMISILQESSFPSS
ncbi:hypothetical protein BS78_K337000 [Paspalum vaginatum]|uniref:Uncharacterized protein n=1 Tax=Paspalum vaginatum TaxID=158149 RepID=A0A9W7XDM9_9POAL|nr:hypothetical protein BS78_K337000 [Paspalum vaginatum]